MAQVVYEMRKNTEQPHYMKFYNVAPVCIRHENSAPLSTATAAVATTEEAEEEQTATEKSVQLRAKLFACDQEHVEVVGENKCRKSLGDECAFVCDGCGLEAMRCPIHPFSAPRVCTGA